MEEQTLDQILNVISDDQQKWINQGHKCFGRYMEYPDWRCKELVRAGIEGCVACKEWSFHAKKP